MSEYQIPSPLVDWDADIILEVETPFMISN